MKFKKGEDPEHFYTLFSTNKDIARAKTSKCVSVAAFCTSNLKHLAPGSFTQISHNTLPHNKIDR